MILFYEGDVTQAVVECVEWDRACPGDDMNQSAFVGFLTKRSDVNNAGVFSVYEELSCFVPPGRWGRSLPPDTHRQMAATSCSAC